MTSAEINTLSDAYRGWDIPDSHGRIDPNKYIKLRYAIARSQGVPRPPTFRGWLALMCRPEWRFEPDLVEILHEALAQVNL